MKAILWLAVLLVLALGGMALARTASPPPEAAEPKKAVEPIRDDEARSFAFQIIHTAELIVDEYVRPITPQKLVGAAIVGMYEAAGTPLPAPLRADAEKELAGRDLEAELFRYRKELGNPPALRGENAIRVALQAMMQALDPHSAYIGPEDAWQLTQSRGPQLGVGLTLEERTGAGPLVVRSVALEGPAQQGGLRPGDLVLEINGEPTAAMNLGQAQARINGDPNRPGSETRLVIQRYGEKSPRQVVLQRALFEERTVLGARRLSGGGWDYLVDHNPRIGLVRFLSINERTPADLAQAMAELQEMGMVGLILDLRECPGGLLKDAMWIAHSFVDRNKGTVAKVSYRKPVASLATPVPDTRYLGFPMIVLIGPDTSGGGELIAAALQDHGRALVAGQRSRGKASIQSVPTALQVRGPHAIKITTGLFFPPSGRNLHRFPESKPSDAWGVLPDPELEMPLSLSLRRQLREWRLLQDLRPPEAIDTLPLDDPQADPVLAAARHRLRKLLEPKAKQ